MEPCTVQGIRISRTIQGSVCLGSDRASGRTALNRSVQDAASIGRDFWISDAFGSGAVLDALHEVDRGIGDF